MSLRNNILDRTINVLGKLKAKPDHHKIALDAILNDETTNDQEKLLAMRTYFHDAVQNVIDHA